MAKLYFKYGAMGSSKTAQALMFDFNYREKGKTTILFKPSIDTRDGETVIKSRIGLETSAEVISPDESFFDIPAPDLEGLSAIIVDECQFLTVEQVEELKTITEEYDIPVFCFGLKTNFKTQLFPASKRLIEIADSISEIKSICKCGKKAIINVRFDKLGNVVTDGEEFEVGGNEKYEGMCYSCYKKKLKEEKKTEPYFKFTIHLIIDEKEFSAQHYCSEQDFHSEKFTFTDFLFDFLPATFKGNPKTGDYCFWGNCQHIVSGIIVSEETYPPSYIHYDAEDQKHYFYQGEAA